MKLLFILSIMVMISVIAVTSEMPMRRQEGNYNAAADEFYAARLATSLKYFDMEKTDNAQKMLTRRFPLTCKNNPMICKNAKNGTPSGTDQCCMKKCVNILKDKNNCGRSGHKCKFLKITLNIVAHAIIGATKEHTVLLVAAKNIFLM
ncbi:hypothetical protein MKW98_023918 [Papaver atlanticum]|uniref:Uncharacterized protein n=1 Tax=Papaver atlanticum TaxID=357466 RepID=A0AAD4SXV7_9MAGN|nr:hypothetical protein MKW98_023918 [Papaver atlanticum]